MENKLLIIHGGGPTAVLNASLYGAIKEAQKSGQFASIYGANNGTGGVLKREFLNLESLSEEKLELLLHTPGSAIGTSRDVLSPESYEYIANILWEHGIHHVLFNGGPGTMDACGRLYEVCHRNKYDIKIMGIPKTMDNDLSVTDHSPGYGSAARYLASSVREVCADVKGLPIHVVVIEASGRNAGWITAASALADETGEFGPDLIYLPERPFYEEQFIEDVGNLLKRKSGIVVVASEGLRKEDGTPVVDPIFRVGRSVYFGDVCTHLANLVIRRLGYKARGEKPGLLGRSSMNFVSPVDRKEAIEAGTVAVKAVLNGESGKMVAFERISSNPYQAKPFLTDISRVMLEEKKLPEKFINKRGNGVTQEFLDWCRPLIGEAFPEMISLNKQGEKRC